MTPPADKPMDRSEAVRTATHVLAVGPEWSTYQDAAILARAVLAMDEELRKAAESGKEI